MINLEVKMSVEEDVMKIQKKLTKMTSDDGTVGVVIDIIKLQ